MAIKKPFPQESAGCWGIMGNKDDISHKYPMKGYMIKARWSEVQPNPDKECDWGAMDEKIEAAIAQEAKVGLALNIGPDAPQWIYDTVPKIITDKYHSSLLSVDEIKDFPNLARKLAEASDPVLQFLYNKFTPSTQQLLSDYVNDDGGSDPQKELDDTLTLVNELNQLLKAKRPQEEEVSEGGTSEIETPQELVLIYDPNRFAGVDLSQRTKELIKEIEEIKKIEEIEEIEEIKENPKLEKKLIHLHRLLLEDAYPAEIAKGGYPFPRDPKGNYLKYVTLLIKDFANHIRQLDGKEHILFIQANIGCSGDISYYKGKILEVEDPYPKIDNYDIDNSNEFEDYIYEVWSIYINEFKDTDINILFNTENDYKKMKRNIRKVIRKYSEYSPMIKCGNPTHGYQLNGESLTSDHLIPLLHEPQENGMLLKARGERGDTKSGFWTKYRDWNEYWLVLYALHHGMDIINYRSQEWNPEFDDGQPRFIHAFKKFDQYAGYDKVSDAPGAFCALRKGIDSDDKHTWSEKIFGKRGNKEKEKARIKAIYKHDLNHHDLNKANRERGAKLEDVDHAIRGPMNNREAEDINDIGSKIITGNYNKFMKQIDPDETSVGWWNIGWSKEWSVEQIKEPYGRFARGFDTPLGNQMHFKIDNNFFKGDTTVGSVTILVIYFDDKNNSCFEVNYSNASGNAETATLSDTEIATLFDPETATLSDANNMQKMVECKSTEKWRIARFCVDDFSENGIFTKKAQIQIVRTSGAPILHMIEVLKRS